MSDFASDYSPLAPLLRREGYDWLLTKHPPPVKLFYPTRKRVNFVFIVFLVGLYGGPMSNWSATRQKGSSSDGAVNEARRLYRRATVEILTGKYAGRTAQVRTASRAGGKSLRLQVLIPMTSGEAVSTHLPLSTEGIGWRKVPRDL